MSNKCLKTLSAAYLTARSNPSSGSADLTASQTTMRDGERWRGGEEEREGESV